MAGIVTDVCVVFPALSALAEGHEVLLVSQYLLSIPTHLQCICTYVANTKVAFRSLQAP